MTQRRLEPLIHRLEALSEKAMGFWKRHGPDPQFGGIHGTLDAQGNAIVPTDKGLIQQARHLWSFAAWYRHKEQTEEVKALADGLYRFLTSHFQDSDGEFVFKVNRSGQVVESKKVLYAQSFLIYGMSEYALAFDHDGATQIALEVFRSIDGRAHDETHGGYNQVNDAYWMPDGSEKETNTHIHLMEAFSTLYERTRDPLVGRRAGELMELITQKIIQPAGYAHKDFKLDWSLVGPAVVSYGHDIETFWLIDETAKLLGRARDEQILGPATAIAKNSARWGFDEEQGGFFEEGPLGGPANKREKIWWIQAEALPGLFRLYQHTGDTIYLDQLEATLDVIEGVLLQPSGEWTWGVLPDGSVGPQGPELGEEWKASYHVLRALVYTERWMRADMMPTPGR